MSLRDIRRHVGQLSIAGFAGHSIPADLRSLAREFDLGGVIIFARNIESPEQVAELSQQAQSLAQELPLWVSVDQEGGRVARLKRPFTEWPPMMTLGRSGDVRARRPVRPRARGGAEGRRDLARLHAGPRHAHQSEEPSDRRSRAGGTRRGRGPARRGDHPDAAGRGHRRLRQAFSRSRRHQHRLTSRVAAHRASAGPSGGRGAGAVSSRDPGGRRRDHDRPHPDAGAGRGTARNAVANRSSTDF